MERCRLAGIGIIVAFLVGCSSNKPTSFDCAGESFISSKAWSGKVKESFSIHLFEEVFVTWAGVVSRLDVDDWYLIRRDQVGKNGQGPVYLADVSLDDFALRFSHSTVVPVGDWERRFGTRPYEFYGTSITGIVTRRFGTAEISIEKYLGGGETVVKKFKGQCQKTPEPPPDVF
jgi:hypothetical protein